MPGLTLLRQGSPLASPGRQLEILHECTPQSFVSALAGADLAPLRAVSIETLQVNVGKLCNQTCRHCHVDAGPERREIMTRETMEHCLAALRAHRIPVLDVTGGAPEMNPDFRWFVGAARDLGARVIDRCNLTILVAPGFGDLPEFLAEHEVEIIASLPCYLAENADRQRGDGVFERSIAALRRLNEFGYGRPASGLVLNLVYNPVGPSLPPRQEPLEAAYRKELGERHGVAFNRLFTITNMSVSRFLDDLVANGRAAEYQAKLVAAFNPEAAAGVMCRSLISVGWDGRLYDCDFNQMLDMELRPGFPRHIRDFAAASLAEREIAVGPHCFGCTAGAGSSCQGAVLSA
jgi:radical SAM/Cys-rich protein